MALKLNSEKDKKSGPWYYSFPVLLVLLIIVVFLGRATIKLVDNMATAQNKRQQASAKLADLKSQTQEMRKKVNWLQSQAGKEARLRSNYKVAKPGEHVIVIVDDNATHTNQSEKITDKKSDSSVWDWIKNIF